MALGEEETEASGGVRAAQREVLRRVELLGNKCEAWAPKQTENFI